MAGITELPGADSYLDVPLKRWAESYQTLEVVAYALETYRNAETWELLHQGEHFRAWELATTRQKGTLLAAKFTPGEKKGARPRLVVVGGHDNGGLFMGYITVLGRASRAIEDQLLFKNLLKNDT